MQRWKPFRFFPSISECEDRRPVSTFLGVADAFAADTASLSLEPQPPRLESMLDSEVAVGVPSSAVGIVELDPKIDSMPPVRTNPEFVDQVFSSDTIFSENLFPEIDEPMLTQL